jgi:hypothetical protein
MPHLRLAEVLEGAPPAKFKSALEGKTVLQVCARLEPATSRQLPARLQPAGKPAAPRLPAAAPPRHPPRPRHRRRPLLTDCAPPLVGSCLLRPLAPPSTPHQVGRKGKNLWLELSGGTSLLCHLGMDGELLSKLGRQQLGCRRPSRAKRPGWLAPSGGETGPLGGWPGLLSVRAQRSSHTVCPLPIAAM